MVKKKTAALGAAVMMVALGTGTQGLKAQGSAADPTPIGAWFGIARPCTRSPHRNPAGTEDPTTCNIACKGPCPVSIFPVDEVTMIPTLLADGTVLADDFAELLDFHSTAHGKWKFMGTEVVDGREVERYQASFIWFQARNPTDIDPNNPLSTFQGVVRPRFVTFFDKTNPNVMRGFIQPYLYPMSDTSGIVKLVDKTPWPAIDPVGPLPETCNPPAVSTTIPTSSPSCYGTLHFFIRRINAE